MTKAEDRKPFQIWADTTQEVIDKAREIAEEKRMTFRGWVGLAIEKCVEAEKND